MNVISYDQRGLPVSRGSSKYGGASGRGTPGARTRRRVLYIFCSPENTRHLALEREVVAIREAGLLQYEEDLLLEATWDSLNLKLSQYPYDMVHFGGHAKREGLALRDPRTGEKVLITPETLADLLCQFKSIKAIVLNACYTEALAEVCANAGIPFCMYWKGKVHDDAVPTFTKFFYLAALNNISYSEAFNIAREQMRAHGFVIANPDDFLVGAIPVGPPCGCSSQNLQPIYSVQAHGLPGYKVAPRHSSSKPNPRLSYSMARRSASAQDHHPQERRAVKTSAWPRESPIIPFQTSDRGSATPHFPTLSRSPSAFGIRY